MEAMRRQREEIANAQQILGDSIRLLWGAEVEIKADGALDYEDDFLAEMDIVIASLHTSLRQPRDVITERLLKAIRNPHVDVIGHPTGRMLPNREGADLDMEAVFKAAFETQTALEVNAHPSRLDLDAAYIRRAIESGIPLCINTDAHAASDLDLLHFGVATRPPRLGNTQQYHQHLGNRPVGSTGFNAPERLRKGKTDLPGCTCSRIW